MKVITLRRLMHFNPRTPRGVRHVTRRVDTAEADFNPRTPRGVRPEEVFLLEVVPDISIRAPLAGCDPKHNHHQDAKYHFNPRTPRGVRRLFGAFAY